MPLHLIKLCVGADTPEDLRLWRAQRAAAGFRPIVHTRQTPKRADEIVDGGSLFWVIRGEVLCRQRLLDVRPFVDKSGIGRCQLVLEPKVVLVEPRPYRAIGYPILPAMYILIATFIDVVLLRYKPQYTWPGLIIVLLGIPVYFLWSRRNPQVREQA